MSEEGESSTAGNVGGASMAGSGYLGIAGGRPVATYIRGIHPITYIHSIDEF